MKESRSPAASASITGCSGRVGLEHHTAGAPAAPGTPAHLMEQLICALGRAHVAARKAQVGIDHAHQGELPGSGAPLATICVPISTSTS